VLTKIFGDVIVVAGNLVTVFAGVLELGTEVALELVAGLSITIVDGLFGGDLDLTELVVTLLFFYL
jgi:hypothetical protein